jgi:hypothetical protein
VDADFYEGQGRDPFEIIREDNRAVDDYITRHIEETVARTIDAPPRFGEALVGEIGVGDYVKTLHLAKAVYGKVTGTRRKGRVLVVLGRTQPGAPLVTREASPENLDLHFKAGTLPEDLRGHYE